MSIVGENLDSGPFPELDPGKRKRLVNNDICPECGGSLDTGWECNACGFDALPIAYTEMDKHGDD